MCGVQLLKSDGKLEPKVARFVQTAQNVTGSMLNYSLHPKDCLSGLNRCDALCSASYYTLSNKVDYPRNSIDPKDLESDEEATPGIMARARQVLVLTQKRRQEKQSKDALDAIQAEGKAGKENKVKVEGDGGGARRGRPPKSSETATVTTTSTVTQEVKKWQKFVIFYYYRHIYHSGEQLKSEEKYKKVHLLFSENLPFFIGKTKNPANQRLGLDFSQIDDLQANSLNQDAMMSISKDKALSNQNVWDKGMEAAKDFTKFFAGLSGLCQVFKFKAKTGGGYEVEYASGDQPDAALEKLRVAMYRNENRNVVFVDTEEDDNLDAPPTFLPLNYLLFKWFVIKRKEINAENCPFIDELVSMHMRGGADANAGEKTIQAQKRSRSDLERDKREQAHSSKTNSTLERSSNLLATVELRKEKDDLVSEKMASLQSIAVRRSILDGQIKLLDSKDDDYDSERKRIKTDLKKLEAESNEIEERYQSQKENIEGKIRNLGAAISQPQLTTAKNSAAKSTPLSISTSINLFAQASPVIPSSLSSSSSSSSTASTSVEGSALSE